MTTEINLWEYTDEELKKAIETYKLIISKQDETKLVVNFEKDIASPFFKHRIQKYHLKGKYDNNNQGIREQKRFNNYMKNFFTGFDYNNHELLSQAITDLTHNLKEDKKTDNTISKYMSVLNQMFKRAKNIGVLKSLPDMPSLNVINAPRQSYFNEELNHFIQVCSDLQIFESHDSSERRGRKTVFS